MFEKRNLKFRIKNMWFKYKIIFYGLIPFLFSIVFGIIYYYILLTSYMITRNYHFYFPIVVFFLCSIFTFVILKKGIRIEDKEFERYKRKDIIKYMHLLILTMSITLYIVFLLMMVSYLFWSKGIFHFLWDILFDITQISRRIGSIMVINILLYMSLDALRIKIKKVKK